jgi:HK97 family phage prohead protease
MATARMDYDFNLSDEHVRLADDGALIVSGWASNFDVDRVGDQVTRDAIKAALGKYMRNPVVLYNHKYSQPAGVVTKARVDDERGLWVELKLPRPEVPGMPQHYWNLVKAGVLRGLSIGGQWTRTKLANGVNALTAIDLREISVAASVPVNAGTLLSTQTAKAFADEPEALTVARREAAAARVASESAFLIGARLDLMESRRNRMTT